MPHIIIEHSANFSSRTIKAIGAEIPQIMAAVTEGNFDVNQCKVRSQVFTEFLVGNFSEENSSFIHVTIKVLAGRSVDARKKVAENVVKFLEEKCAKEISTTRHDLSVDVVEMDRDVYQKKTIS